MQGESPHGFSLRKKLRPAAGLPRFDICIMHRSKLNIERSFILNGINSLTFVFSIPTKLGFHKKTMNGNLDRMGLQQNL
jgi:hypothetical protein